MNSSNPEPALNFQVSSASAAAATPALSLSATRSDTEKNGGGAPRPSVRIFAVGGSGQAAPSTSARPAQPMSLAAAGLVCSPAQR